MTFTLRIRIDGELNGETIASAVSRLNLAELIGPDPLNPGNGDTIPAELDETQTPRIGEWSVQDNSSWGKAETK